MSRGVERAHHAQPNEPSDPDLMLAECELPMLGTVSPIQSDCSPDRKMAIDVKLFHMLEICAAGTDPQLHGDSAPIYHHRIPY